MFDLYELYKFIEPQWSNFIEIALHEVHWSSFTEVTEEELLSVASRLGNLLDWIYFEIQTLNLVTIGKVFANASWSSDYLLVY